MNKCKTIALCAAAALAFTLAGCGSDSSTASSTSSSTAPDCSTGTSSADIASDVPTWIQDNFTCVRVTVSGNNIVIETQNLPPYTSTTTVRDTHSLTRRFPPPPILT